MDSLYNDIRLNGYKTQVELLSEQGSSDFLDRLVNEITIDIGRDGQLLHVDSKHRLAIAKLLNLDKVPVFCDHRHEDWMKKRDELFRRGACDVHPDVPRQHEN